MSLDRGDEAPSGPLPRSLSVQLGPETVVPVLPADPEPGLGPELVGEAAAHLPLRPHRLPHPGLLTDPETGAVM